MAADPNTKLLNDGTRVPILAFGTATVHFEKDCTDAIVLALRKGFRHLDAAHGYANEESLGKALKQWEGDREEVYITSKWGWDKTDDDHDPGTELRESLKKIGVEYLDLYLMHVPHPKPLTNAKAWMQMEALQKQGLVRSIGISNFRAEDIEEIAKVWTVRPAVNQIEYHPYSFHDPRMMKMEEACKKYGIAISPYTTLAPITAFPGLALDPILQRISRRAGITPAQVLLAWARQRTDGGPIVTTASKEWQYQPLLDSLAVRLSEEEMEEVAEAGRRGGVHGTWTLPGWDAEDGSA